MDKNKMIDIGANMLDEMYTGFYNGKKYHENDVGSVLERSNKYGVEKLILTSGSLEDVQKALILTKQHPNLKTTAGIHPTRCNEIRDYPKGDDAYIDELIQLIKLEKEMIVAVGEFGLDYDRIQYCDIETQKKYFEKQFRICESFPDLSLFLHLRGSSATEDFIDIVKRNRSHFKYGVVHSFDGSLEDMNKLISLDLSIGINGCSLKTEENLNVVREIPIDRLLIETDAPWCQIRPSHASFKYVKTKFAEKDKKKYSSDSFVKGRNEPAYLIQVAEVIAGVKNIPIDGLLEKIYENTQKTFFVK
jgi:TatD DNase family protein